MSSSSVESDPAAGSRSLFDRPAAQVGEASGYEHYRSLSGAAVVSLILGVVSVVALLDFWVLKVLPAFGLVLALVAIVRIRRQSDELTGMKAAKLGLALSLAFLVVGSSLSIYTYATEVPPGYERISYETLKHPDEALRNSASPAALALEGKRIFIKGFMFPPPHEKGVTKFVLCRDNGDCCFGGQPPASDMIFVDLVPGLDTHYDRKLRHVAGTFHVAGSHSKDVNKDVLYRLDADYIK